jgi:three-Cys-motif partner protein
MNEATLWPLEPHTGAKHEILKRYLDRWFPIVGKKFKQLNYIDGFAGPGKYSTGEEGSPILAIKSALEHVNRGTLNPKVTVNFFFVEERRDHAKFLESELGKIKLPSQFKIKLMIGEFRANVSSILDEIEADILRITPTFAFVDPFGFKGLPMSIMAKLLSLPSSELLVNVMVDFVNRFIEHPNDNIKDHFPEMFGTEDVLQIPSLSGNRLDQILSMYRQQLEKFAEFVRRFDMHNRRDRKTYSLFFASNSPAGFLKIKEAMWKVDRHDGNLFSDKDPNPTNLFEAWGLEPLWDILNDKFAGQTVPMASLTKFVEVKTGYIRKQLTDILKQREDSGQIRVEILPNCKRHGQTFHDDKVQILFPT